MKQLYWIVCACLALAATAVAEEPSSCAAGGDEPVIGLKVQKPLPGAKAAETPEPAARPESGYRLLDGLANLFAVPYGNGEELENRLNKLMKLARSAYEKREIPLPFFNRYHRLLGLFRIVTLKDPEGVVKPVLQAQVDEFVRETIGAEPGMESKLPHVAAAIEEEIVNLQLYLDTLKARQALLMGLREKLPPPPPPKPDKK